MPGVGADALAVLVVEVDRVDQLAVDVELELVDGAVADPHRPGVAVAAQVVELGLVGDVAVDVVEHPQRAEVVGRAVLGRVRHPVREPAHERRRLVGEAEPQQRVEAERGVADPHVAVVPVAAPAHRLGQARGRRGDDRAGRLVGEQLERQGGAVDRLAPASGVRRARHPRPPELRGPLEQPVAVDLAGGGHLLAVAEDLEHEQRLLALAQPEVGEHVAVLQAQVDARGQPQAYAVPGDQHAVLDGLGRGVGAAVVGPGGQAHRQLGGAAHGAHAAHDALAVVGVGRLEDRHEVVDLGDAALGHEPGDQDGAVGEVELAGAGARRGRAEPPGAAAARVEQRAEDAGGVEPAGAEPVDGALGAHERAGAQVADQAVLRDREVVVDRRLSHGAASRRPASPARPRVPRTRAGRAAPEAATGAPARTPARGGRPRRRG